jgi:EPS-associated MarR family transcriptional regulator
LQEESHLKVLRLIEAQPNTSQRDLAGALGLSLGGVNYCVRALLDKGLIKMHNFNNSQNKRAYAYLLTPAGMAAKAELTARFLKYKLAEFDRLQAEIQTLQQDLKRHSGGPDA